MNQQVKKHFHPFQGVPANGINVWFAVVPALLCKLPS
jgi:hypothetical protein